MKAPMCPHCKTDEFLKYSDPIEGHEITVVSRAHQGGKTIGKRKPIRPVVDYTCQKCGYFNGHTVPDGWTRPTDD